MCCERERHTEPDTHIERVTEMWSNSDLFELFSVGSLGCARFATNAPRNCVNQLCRTWQTKKKRLDSRYCIAAEAIAIVVVPSNACHTREHFMFVLWWRFQCERFFHSLQVSMDAHFMGISASVCNDTHRTCNAQQLRMDFRQTDWPNANGIKSEIRGTHQNNLTAETATDDSARAEIHLFLVCFVFTMNWSRRANSKWFGVGVVAKAENRCHLLRPNERRFSSQPKGNIRNAFVFLTR